MSTLLRTNTTASKLVAGFYPVGIAPHYPPPNINKAIAIQDSADDLLSRQSLQNAVSRQANAISFSGPQSVKGVNVVVRRYAHSDVRFPNFDSYRHDSTKDPNKAALESEDERRAVPNALIYGVGGVLSIFTAKTMVHGFVQYKSMAAAQLALANIEVNLAEIPEGKCKTFEWRGKPVFVRHRSEKEVAEVRSVDVSSLRHPEKDEDRVQNPEWSVLIGICTHLGCVPFANMGDFGGYYCPCHGSHYDASGRIRKGPAPLNMFIPDYAFIPGGKIRVG